MKLHFYNEVIGNGKLFDKASLTPLEQERITRHQEYLTRLLDPVTGCRATQERVSVLFELRRGRITYSVFVCCGVHGYEIQQLLIRRKAPLDSMIVRKKTEPLAQYEPSWQPAPRRYQSLWRAFWLACYRLRRSFSTNQKLAARQFQTTSK